MRYLFLVLAGLGSHWNALSQAQTTSDPVIYFLCARREFFSEDAPLIESFVIPIQKPEHLAMARRLVGASDFNHYWPFGWVVFENDGINRNYLIAGRPERRWRMVEFIDFKQGLTPEDSAYPEQLDEMADNLPPDTRKLLGFPDSGIIAELGPTPCIVDVVVQGDGLRLDWPDFGPAYRYTLEASASLASPNWQPVAGHDWPSTDTEFTVPLSEGTGRFFRVNITPAP